MSFEAFVFPMPNGTNREIGLEFLECLLDLGQLDMELPWFRRGLAFQVRAQQVMAFAPAHLPQLGGQVDARLVNGLPRLSQSCR